MDEYDASVTYTSRYYKKPDFYPKDEHATVYALFHNPQVGKANGYHLQSLF